MKCILRLKNASLSQWILKVVEQGQLLLGFQHENLAKKGWLWISKKYFKNKLVFGVPVESVFEARLFEWSYECRHWRRWPSKTGNQNGPWSHHVQGWCLRNPAINKCLKKLLRLKFIWCGLSLRKLHKGLSWLGSVKISSSKKFNLKLLSHF